MRGPFSLTDNAPTAVVHGGSVRHESFFFESGSDQLYASLYAPEKSAIRLGVVLCQPWGADAMALYGWCHRTARDLATAGIATVVPHWPGAFDSEGDPRALTIDRIVLAGVDSVTAVTQRCDVPAWGTFGIGVGAAWAATLTTALDARRCVLVQPALDPSAHFADAERRSRRASLGAAPMSGWAFGYPIPPALCDASATERVTVAVGGFTGRGAVVQYRKPSGAMTPSNFETVTIRGHWGRPSRNDRQHLRRTAARWLARSLRSAA